MKVFYLCCFLLSVLLTPLYVFGFQNVTAADSNEVIKYNKEAFSVRKAVPLRTISLATKALEIAKAIHYGNGIAESYRVIGIGYSYKFDQVHAFENYLNALQSYKNEGNRLGQARVNNNIGNLYRDSEFSMALEYFETALKIADKLGDKSLIASINLNMANVYVRQKQFATAITKFAICKKIFLDLKDSSNIISCDQNAGVAYFGLNDFDTAEKFLLAAHAGAKQLPDLNAAVASIDLTLADVYIAKKEFAKAQQAIDEGVEQDRSAKIQADFQYTQYQLEYKQKHYEKALTILQEIYRLDRADAEAKTADQITLFKIQKEQDKTVRDQQRIIDRNQNSRNLSWGAMTMTFLLIILVGSLVVNVKRKAETNKKLNELNSEVSRQKDNLNRINHHLEEIIDERTKDLQIKNKKLSEYSSYLSHQIRGPIATLKGLMNLEKEGLVDEKECINMMNKCVSEIDDKIMDMSDMLHDPDRAGF